MKPYALHLYLWLLTGRSDDFVSTGLRHVIRYATLPPSADVLAARALLALDITATDFHVFSAMAAAYASAPVLRSLPAEQSVMFISGMSELPLLTVSGASLVQPSASQWANLRYHPQQIPAATTWTVTHSGTYVTLTNNLGLLERLPLRSSQDVVYLDLQSILSADTAVGFRYAGTWTTGASFSFSIPPSRYPFAAVAEKIRVSSAAIKLMSDHGTLEAFSNSIDPLRKVGALASAIMLAVAKAALDAGIALAGTHVLAAEDASINGITFDPEGRLLLNGYPLSFEGAALLLDLDALIL